MSNELGVTVVIILLVWASRLIGFVDPCYNTSYTTRLRLRRRTDMCMKLYNVMLADVSRDYLTTMYCGGSCRARCRRSGMFASKRRNKRRKHVVAGPGSGTYVGMCTEHITARYKSSLLKIDVLLRFFCE